MIEMPISESPALFIFAHQDDECGCFSELNRLVDRGDEVFVVYLTSGTPRWTTLTTKKFGECRYLGKNRDCEK